MGAFMFPGAYQTGGQAPMFGGFAGGNGEACHEQYPAFLSCYFS